MTQINLDDVQKMMPLFFNTTMTNRPFHNYAMTGQPNQVLRHEQFSWHLGSPTLTVPSVGWFIDKDGKVSRKPVFMVCDPLSLDGGGLTPPDMKQSECLSLAVEATMIDGGQIAIVADSHVSSQHVNQQADTSLLITIDYYAQMIEEEQVRADRYLFDKMEIPPRTERQRHIQAGQGTSSQVAERWQRYAQNNMRMPDDGQEPQSLTVAELELMLGASLDYEFRDSHFPFEHCIEAISGGSAAVGRFLPRIQSLLERIFVHNKQQRKGGNSAPTSNLWVFNKADLSPAVHPDQRGTGGNLLDTYLQYVQYGTPQGPNHDHERRIVIAGNGTPYTALYGALNAIAKGYSVTMLASSIFNFDDAGVSLIEVIRFLRHLFPFAFTARIFWDVDTMGGVEMPVAANGQTYDEIAQEILDELVAQWRSTGGASLNTAFYPFGDDGLTLNVFEDAQL